MIFISPTHGKMTFGQMMQKCEHFLIESNQTCNIIVGTDSQNIKSKTRFVTSLCIHKHYSGGIYFYCVCFERKMVFHERIFEEAFKSINLAEKIAPVIGKPDIHIDAGYNGKTKTILAGLTGMVKGYGFNAIIKPSAFVASCIADKHTKTR